MSEYMVTTPDHQAKHCCSKAEVVAFLAQRTDAIHCVVWQLPPDGGIGAGRRIDPADIPDPTG